MLGIFGLHLHMKTNRSIESNSGFSYTVKVTDRKMKRRYEYFIRQITSIYTESKNLVWFTHFLGSLACPKMNSLFLVKLTNLISNILSQFDLFLNEPITQ